MWDKIKLTSVLKLTTTLFWSRQGELKLLRSQENMQYHYNFTSAELLLDQRPKEVTGSHKLENQT
jgi:hypothetical protein